ncbi:MAG: VWA domain-containing protein [Candidatus Altiarchaeota archaeon]|nr:VWA domain-containing protein [Candidatus Altiarchaeota archaeon]
MALEFQNIGIENPYVLLLIIPAAFLIHRYVQKGGMNREKKIFIASRTVIVFLLLLALSVPYIIEETREFRDAASVMFLYDASGSMALYPEEIHSRVDELYRTVRSTVGNMTGYPDAVSIQYFSEGNRTEIGNVLYQNALKTDTESNLLLLISDGNNNYGRDAEDVAAVLAGMNTTVSALIPDSAARDVYLADIRGEKKVPADTEYRIIVKVGKTGEGRADYQLNLYVDDNQANSVDAFQDEDMTSRAFVLSFSERGPHRIVAEIIPEGEDYFAMNNRFLKAIDVVDKPHVLLISDDSDSPLFKVLQESYVVTVTPGPTMDFDSYDVVFIDNKAIGELGSGFVSSMNAYVVDGNGLVVVGGDDSYENGGYYNSDLERILPVVSAEIPKERRKEIAVLFLIDISESTEYGVGGESKIDVEKAVAINMLRQLNDNDKVGAVAFNYNGYILSALNSLSNNKDSLENQIYSLKFGGGTDMLPGLLIAETLIEDFQGDKYVIILSDGVIGSKSRREPTLGQVAAMADKGIFVYTVGVGFDTDEGFMSQLAQNGGGIYFRPTEYQRLKLEFGQGGQDKDGKNSISIYNRYHFITQDLEDTDVEALTVSKYNGVTDKSIAQMLITAGGKKPLVTAWRFGLGRVVSISTDNGKGWGSNLYKVANGQLVNAITNWAIGDLEKGKKTIINSRDTFIDRESSISIESTEVPYLLAQHESSSEWRGIGFKQIDVEEYTGTLYPDMMGFYFLRAGSGSGEDTDAVAVNYPVEYSMLGADRDSLSRVTGTTRGLIYGMSQLEELEQDIVSYAREGTMKKTVKKNPLVMYLAILALLIFFTDVVVRRVREIRRMTEE